ncbi:MAG: type II toxin-antitoxin system mRNA interferase toxin, RelE/StbE family [Candidatus Taylorbacteria bacterium]|nr:type II toxin-antitoxin system mRNA interferase toxin, RelE/StbE family [Candidatus Taylorbacteria bacterium]
MWRVDTTPKFDRQLIDFVKSHPDLRDKTRDLIDRLSKNPFDRQGKIHKLSGKLNGMHAVSINWNYRLVYIIGLKSITFINIGSHDEVY